MKRPITPFWRIAADTDQSAERFLLQWRLWLLGIALVGLGCWHGFYEPIPAIWALIVAFGLTSAWTLTLLLQPAFQGRRHNELREIIIDLVWVFVIALLAGRSTNPFIYYFLVIVALAATLLKAKNAWIVCGFSILLYTILLLLDVRVHFLHFSADYQIHLIGMWLNFLLSTLITCAFISYLVTVIRHKDNTMHEFRERNLKNEQLVGLATVAASAVHHIATPLSTLKLLVDNASEGQGTRAISADDLALMGTQIGRCQETIDELSALAQKNDQIAVYSVASVAHDLRDHYLLQHPDRDIHISDNGLNPDACIECSLLFQYALINLINNAVESSMLPVAIRFNTDNDTLRIDIENRCEQHSHRLEDGWGRLSESAKPQGLGIGSMLANTTIENEGGTVEIELVNLVDSTLTDVIVSVVFPLTETTLNRA